jgi:hypothetical protein
MSSSRFVGAVLAAFAVAAAAFAPACSNDAVGIEACRAIEAARCEAAFACEGDTPSFGIATEEQVENCKTFYIDHCLVGIENTEDDDISPDTADNCVLAIQAVHACQTADNKDLAECNLPPDDDGNVVPVELIADAEITTPCEAIRFPEQLKACKFIAKEEDD